MDLYFFSFCIVGHFFLRASQFLSLLRGQFAWNAKAYFLGKLKKILSQHAKLNRHHKVTYSTKSFILKPIVGVEEVTKKAKEQLQLIFTTFWANSAD